MRATSVVSWHRFLIWGLLNILLIGAGVTLASGASSTPRVEVLDNGLRVVLLEDPSSSLVAASVWIHAGGKDESEEVAGFSHFLEHLIPLGSKGRSPRQEQLEIFRAGGISQVQADYDRTYFFTEVKPSALEVALTTLANQVSGALLDPVAIQKIRPSLRQELRGIYRDPGQVLFLEQMRAAFPENPYRIPYQGSFGSLKTLGHDGAEAFYANFYVPNNMVLAIGGNVESSSALALAMKHFGSLKPSKTLPPKPQFEKPAPGPRQVAKQLDRMEPSISFLFPTPGYRHPDRYALEVLAHLLGNPSSSPLVKRLGEDQGSILTISSKFHLFEERGLLAFTLFPASARDTVEAGNKLGDTLRATRNSGFSEAQVQLATRQIILAETVRRDSVGQRIQDLAEGALFGDFRYGRDLEQNLSRVKSADVQQVANTYLTERNATTLLIHPTGARDLRETDLETLSMAPREIGGAEGEDPSPINYSLTQYGPDQKGPHAAKKNRKPPGKTKKVVLDNGLTLLIKPQPGRGLAAVTLFVKAGSVFDPTGKEGLAQMAASAIALGPESRPTEWFTDQVAATGSAYHVTATVETVEAGLIVFPKDLSSALELLAGPVISPGYSKGRLELIRKRSQKIAQDLFSNPTESARALLREKIYRGHPYAKPIAGTHDSLADITTQDLIGFHHSLYRPHRAVLTLVGDLDPRQAQELATAAFSSWKASDEPSPAVALEKNATREAAHGDFSPGPDFRSPMVLVGYPGVPLAHPDFPLLRALGTVLTARGVLDLVFDKPLAYSVTATPEGLAQGGMFYVEAFGATASPSQLAYEILLQARALAVKEIPPVTLQDLLRIERGRMAREKDSLYTLASNLGYFEVLGAGYQAYDEVPSIPADLTPEQLKEAAAKYLPASRQVRITPAAN